MWISIFCLDSPNIELCLNNLWQYDSLKVLLFSFSLVYNEKCKEKITEQKLIIIIIV